MKISQIIKCLFLWMLSFNILQMPHLYGETAAIEEADCSQQALRAYFPEKFVKSTLKKFNIPEDKWGGIVQGLKGREKDVEIIVETNAEKMNPNPLRDPQQRQAAVKLFKDALFQVASETFKKNGVNDDQQIRSMLDDIQQQKIKQFAECIEKHKLPMPPRPEARPAQ